jgi:hemerythrin-like domain-containing protein
MKPITDLVIEHGAIKLMLRVMEKINEKISHGELVPALDLNDSLTFLKEFADNCHHGKEEDLLFPMMKKNNIPQEVELIEILLAEHAQARGYIKNMVAAILKKDFLEAYLDNSKRYIALLDQHINKENAVLFPEANRSLSLDQLQELEAGFDRVEREIGVGRHEELHGIANRLKESYI